MSTSSAHPAHQVIRPAGYMPAYLNRQIVALLSTLDVPDGVFVQLQVRQEVPLLGCPLAAAPARECGQQASEGARHKGPRAPQWRRGT